MLTILLLGKNQMQSPKSIKHKTIISKAAPQAVKSILVCNANSVKPKTKTTVIPTAIRTSSALKAVTAHPSMTPSTEKKAKILNKFKSRI